MSSEHADQAREQLKREINNILSSFTALSEKLVRQKSELRMWEDIADGEIEIEVDNMEERDIIIRTAMDNIVEMNKKIAQTTSEFDLLNENLEKMKRRAKL